MSRCDALPIINNSPINSISEDFNILKYSNQYFSKELPATTSETKNFASRVQKKSFLSESGHQAETVKKTNGFNSDSHDNLISFKGNEESGNLSYSENFPPKKIRNVFTNGWIEIIFNVIGTLGFFIGSVLWVYGPPVLTSGTIIFAGANLFSTVSCIIYSIKFYLDYDYIGVFALVQQSVGCIIFAIHCIEAVYWIGLNQTIPLLGFLLASLLCFSGCLLTQVQCLSITGIMAKIWPSLPYKIIPTSLCNTIGAYIFCVGSYALFFNITEQFGAWCYAIGSACYVFAAWGDAMIWWTLGATQSEHINVLPQHKFIDTKFK